MTERYTAAGDSDRSDTEAEGLSGTHAPSRNTRPRDAELAADERADYRPGCRSSTDGRQSLPWASFQTKPSGSAAAAATPFESRSPKRSITQGSHRPISRARISTSALVRAKIMRETT